MKKLTKRIGKIKDKRDVLAHATWQPGKKPGFIKPLGMKTVGTIKILQGELNSDGIAHAASEAHAAGRELVSFFQNRGLLQLDLK